MNTIAIAGRGIVEDRRIGWSTLDETSSPPKWIGTTLTDRATSARPALAWFQEKLFMAWRGPGEDQNLFWATLEIQMGNPQPWSPQHGPISNRASLNGPALASYHGRLYMAWRGAGDDNRLFWATFDGQGDWSSQQEAKDRGSLFSPAMAVFQDKLYMAWRGAGEDDQRLFWATFDETAQKWFPQQEISNRGSARGPALVSFRDELFMFWRGIDDDTRLFFATFNGQGNNPQWSPQKLAEPTLHSFDTPSLVVFRDELYIAHSDKVLAFGDDDPEFSGFQILFVKFDGKKFVPTTIPSLVSSAPLALTLLPETDFNEQPPTGRKTFSKSGNFIQSTFGKQGNFELVVPQDNRLVHYFRDNDAPAFPWHKSGSTLSDFVSFGGIPGLRVTPIAVTLIQSNFGNPGNFELIARMTRSNGGGDFLAFYFFDSNSHKWNGPFRLEADGQPIEGVTGNPALIQSSFGKQGNFELVVPQDNRLVHYFRDNDDPAFPWHKSGSPISGFGGDIPGLRPTPLAVSLIQSNFGNPGNFELIARMTSGRATGDGDFLAFYFFDSSSRRWNGPFPLEADGQPIEGVTGNPALIQSSFGKQGNFELVVPQDNRLVHYFRDNDDPAFPWHKSGSPISGFGGDIPGLRPTPLAVSLIQSNFGNPGNFELIARMTSGRATGDGDFLAFYFFDSSSRRWNGPFPLEADGQPVERIAGF